MLPPMVTRTQLIKPKKNIERTVMTVRNPVQDRVERTPSEGKTINPGESTSERKREEVSLERKKNERKWLRNLKRKAVRRRKKALRDLEGRRSQEKKARKKAWKLRRMRKRHQKKLLGNKVRMGLERRKRTPPRIRPRI